MATTTKENVTYDAFISYRHADLDKFVAETLHKQLEAFRLPRSVAKRKLKGEKTRIKRVFRDKDELPIASDLASPIITALEHTDFLIVICSPRTPSSIWVEREISTFIALHGRERILAVLIEGEPSESFPPALLESEREITLPNGSKSTEKIPVEPLAADIRGKNKHEVAKNLKQELLRLVAPMFNCGYDDLKQRHREQKIKRTMSILLAACAFFLCFGGYSTYQALRIQKQSEQIQQQSNEIAAKSEEIQKQYDEILVTNLNSLGEDSLRLFEEGDRMESIRIAQSALPTSSLDDSLPLVANAEYALSEALYVYQNESDMLPDRTYSHDTDVEFMKLSPSEERMLTVDASNTISIFDTNTGELITSFLADDKDRFSLDETSFQFVTESEIVYMGAETLRRYNFETKEIIWESEEVSFYQFVYSPDLHYVAASEPESICIYDLEDGTIPLVYAPSSDSDDEPLSSINYLGQVMSFSPDSSLLAFSTGNDSVGEIKTIQLDTGEPISTIKTELPNIMSLLFTNQNTLAIAACSTFDFKNLTKENLYGKSGIGDVLLYNIGTSSLIWSQRIEGSYIDKLRMSDSEVPYLAVLGGDCLYSFVLENGTPAGEVSFGSTIVDYMPYPSMTYTLCLLRNGSAETVDLNGGYVYNSLFQTANRNLKTVLRGNHHYYILPYSSRQILSYYYPKNAKMEELLPQEDSAMVRVKHDGSSFIVKPISDEIISVYDSKTKELLFEQTYDDYMDDFLFVGKEEQYIALCFTSKIVFIDSSTGETVQTIESGNITSVKKIVYQEQSQLLFLFHLDGIHIYDTNIPAFKESYELPDFSTRSTAFDTSGTDYIIANKDSSALEVYDFGSSEPKQSLPLNVNYITNLYYNEDCTLLFVVYRNFNVEVYDADTLTCLATYDDFGGATDRCISLTDGSGDYALINGYYGYLCTSTHEKKAFLPYVKAIDTANHRIISYSSNNDLYTMPIYSLDMLLEEAKRQTNHE